MRSEGFSTTGPNLFSNTFANAFLTQQNLTNTSPCSQFFLRLQGCLISAPKFRRGWGGYFSGQKMGIPGRRGGPYINFLGGGGMDIFWNYTFSTVVLIANWGALLTNN